MQARFSRAKYRDQLRKRFKCVGISALSGPHYSGTKQNCNGGLLPIPTYDALMLPVLRHSAEKLWSMRELIAKIADDLKLTQEERGQQVRSGSTTVIASRVHWAKTYLKQAGLVM